MRTEITPVPPKPRSWIDSKTLYSSVKTKKPFKLGTKALLEKKGKVSKKDLAKRNDTIKRNIEVLNQKSKKGQ